MLSRPLHLVFLLILALVQVQCSTRNTIHPTAENIPDATDPSLIIDLSNLDEWEEGPYFPDTTGFETIKYGRLDGEDHELLVWVQDIIHDGNGTLFILDADQRSDRSTDYRTIHMVDLDGQYLGSIGSFGEGPGEFTHPRKLLMTDAGNTLLVVGGERHIEVFGRNEAGSFSFVERIYMPTGVREVCMMRDHLYYVKHDVETDHVIQKYTLTGQQVTGFGEAYKSPNEFLRRDLSNRGAIVCNEELGVIGYVAGHTPVLTGFDEDGSLLWRLKVNGIKPMVVIQEQVAPNGAPQISFSSAVSRTESGRGRLQPGVAYSDGFIYLMVYVSLGDAEFRNLAFRVEAATGAWEHLGHGNVGTVEEKDLRVYAANSLAELIQVYIKKRK